MNNTVNPYLKQYKKNQVETATPEKILILLYDGAIQYLNKAKIAMDAKDIEASHNNIIACENIIIEFMNTLDLEVGGPLAQKLMQLYEYLYNTLVSANINKDMKKLDEVLGHLKGLKETWTKAIEIANAERSQKMAEDDEDSDEDEKDGWGA